MSNPILVILGHPNPDSLCGSLARVYAESAGADLLMLHELKFDHLADPRTVSDIEPDVLRAQGLIRDARHVVFVYPVWWGGPPALLKSFVDRVFTTGFAFRYVEGKPMPERLLLGRSARLLLTMDSPKWWHRWVYRQSGYGWLRWATLWFSGFKVMGVQMFTPVRNAPPARIAGWIAEAGQLGTSDRVKFGTD